MRVENVGWEEVMRPGLRQRSVPGRAVSVIGRVTGTTGALPMSGEV